MSDAGAGGTVGDESDVVWGVADGDGDGGFVGGTGCVWWGTEADGVAAAVGRLRKTRFQSDDQRDAGGVGGQYPDGVERRRARAAGIDPEPGRLGGGGCEEHDGCVAGRGADQPGGSRWAAGVLAGAGRAAQPGTLGVPGSVEGRDRRSADAGAG